MCVKMIRVPKAIAILIASYPLTLKEMEQAISYKETHGYNPEGIHVLLYLPEEREIAHAEYEILANDKPKYTYQHSVPQKG